MRAPRRPVRPSACAGTFRDLRGICSSCNNRRTYSLFFDFIYPAYFPLLREVAACWYHTPSVTTPLLKLMAEIVFNKAQRLTFDSSSPNGILLFRETSSLIFLFGTRILTHEVPAGGNLYEHKYKGIGIALLTLQRALSGNYVNFGVFALYGDKALDDVLSIAIQLCLSMQLSEMMAFPKLAKTYFTLVEILMRNHTATMVKLDTLVLAHITGTLQVSPQAQLGSGSRWLRAACAAATRARLRARRVARGTPEAAESLALVLTPPAPPHLAWRRRARSARRGRCGRAGGPQIARRLDLLAVRRGHREPRGLPLHARARGRADGGGPHAERAYCQGARALPGAAEHLASDHRV